MRQCVCLIHCNVLQVKEEEEEEEEKEEERFLLADKQAEHKMSILLRLLSDGKHDSSRSCSKTVSFLLFRYNQHA